MAAISISLQRLEAEICRLAALPMFIHHQWYVDHHLKIVEQLALELCELHPEADRDIVCAMVWLHDLGKIKTSKTLPRNEEDAITFGDGIALLLEAGFTEDFSTRVIENLRTFEQHQNDLSKAPIEVQIASSADGCAHLIGPFYSLWWYENPQKPVNDLITDNMNKLTKDWERKIVLPEAKLAFQSRRDQILEYQPVNRKKRYFS
ncbi:MAG: HD domain-containing protein [Bdellovibrionales bacterium]